MMLVSLTVALFALCLYLAYRVVGQSVSLDHARAVQRSLEKDHAVLRKLTLDLARTTRRDELEILLAKWYAQDHIVKAEGDTVFVDGVGLRFRGNELVGIVFMSDGSAPERHSPSR